MAKAIRRFQVLGVFQDRRISSRSAALVGRGLERPLSDQLSPFRHLVFRRHVDRRFMLPFS